MVATPNSDLSAGIVVALIHPPLAKAKKSSPGLTDLSMPAISMPDGRAAAAGADVDEFGEQPARLRAATANVVAKNFTDRSIRIKALSVHSFRSEGCLLGPYDT